MAEGTPLRGDRTFRNEVVRISDLTVKEPMIEGLEFSNCRIIGPAILGLLNNVSVVHCTFDAPGWEAVFWEVPPTRGPVVGIIGVDSCTFSNCTFQWIGIAGPPELRAEFERNFKTEQ